MPECPLCGMQVDENDDYCTTCGAELRAKGARAGTVGAVPFGMDERPTPEHWYSRSDQDRNAVDPTPPFSKPPYTEPPEPARGRKTLAIAIAAIAVLAAAVAIGVLLANQGPSKPPSGGVPDPGSSSEPSSSQESESSPGNVKESLSDYTWEELSEIADEISKASGKSAGLDIAAKYHLIGDDKVISSKAVKSVKLADGTKVSVQLVDVYQDDKAGGKGKAGLTFLFDECVDKRAMNDWPSNDGGWAECRMRDWLNSDFIDRLPDELGKNIVKVNKSTNNAGMTASKNSITATEDKLWLPSVHEICGDAQIIGDKDPATNDRLNSIMNKEGKQYKFFADMELAYKPNKKFKTLIRAYEGVNTLWWYRTPSPGRGDLFRAVNDTGAPSSYGIADIAHGVVPGFCL